MDDTRSAVGPNSSSMDTASGAPGLRAAGPEPQVPSTSWRDYAQLLETVSDAVVVVNGTYSIVAWNRAAEVMLGWAAAEVLTTPAASLMSDEMKDILERHRLQVAAGGTSQYVGVTTPLKCRTRAGAMVPCEMTASTWQNGPDRFLGLVLHDVTSRHQAQRDLGRLALAVDHAQEAITITDPDGTIVYVNPAFERASGYTRAEAIGQKPSVLKSGKQDSAFYAELWAKLTRGEVWSGTFINRRKDGTLYEEEGSISPVRDPSGQIVNYVAVKRDTTQERALEVQLSQSQKLEAVGRLAAGIAHEINTPMQFVGDSAQFLANSFQDLLAALAACQQAAKLLAGVPGHEAAAAECARVVEQCDVEFACEEIPRAIERVQTGVSRVSTIVRAMKEFAHPGQHEHTSADLNHMLQTTLVVSHNEYKHVALIDIDLSELPPVVCDSGELNQVFLNLIVNAAQAIADDPKRGEDFGSIAVRTRLDGAFAVVEIEDSGPGIPESHRAHVFEPFFTTKAIGKGTGQGLAIARAIVVEKHGGSLSFESEPGKGTTFTIRLPIAQCAQDTGVTA